MIINPESLERVSAAFSQVTEANQAIHAAMGRAVEGKHRHYMNQIDRAHDCLLVAMERLQEAIRLQKGHIP